MKHYLILIMILAIILTVSCKKDNNKCKTTDFSVSGGNNTATIYIDGNDYGFMEVEYGPNGYSKGSGTTITISNTSQYYLDNLNSGTYDVYIRGNCGGNEWSKWTGPKSFFVSGNANPTTQCNKPTNLSTNSEGYIYWQHVNSDNSEMIYEIEWGGEGLVLGNGIKITTSKLFTYDGVFSKGFKYVFYVRAKCPDGTYSDWAGPKAFTASENHNKCLNPEQVNAFSLYNGVGQCIGPRFTWDRNGEYEWEVNLVDMFGTPGTGNIIKVTQPEKEYYPVSCSSTKDFYVRAVCSNGTKTAWKGPKRW
jgi:hypothetical protein